MNKDTIHFIRSVLPRGRTVFYSFIDRYAVLLLDQVVGNTGKRITDIRKLPEGALLKKRAVRDVIAQRGDGMLTKGDLAKAWPTDPEAFRLSLGTWPTMNTKPQVNWHQISRSGWNLVLQLNFSESHNRAFERLLPDWTIPAYFFSHPIAGAGEITLAWARIDLDLDTGEALIEEIQSDWVRTAHRKSRYGAPSSREPWITYVNEVMQPATRKWSETMLTAALWFLFEEIGIRRVFYHTFETGSRLKNIQYDKPPRSLYTSLPRKFCFRHTHNGPEFLASEANRKFHRVLTAPETDWFVLDYSNEQSA